MEKKSDKNNDYIKELNTKLESVKKYIDNASSYYYEYAKQAPIIFEEVKKQHKASIETIKQIQEFFAGLNEVQNNFAEMAKEEKANVPTLKRNKK